MVALPSRVDPAQRHTHRNPCPICHGGDGDRRGRGIRCYGFTSDDGRYAICTRDEYAGALAKHPRADGYAHRLEGGPCDCGEDHREAIASRPAPRPRTPSAPNTKRRHKRHTPIARHAYLNLDGSVRFSVARFWSGKEPPAWALDDDTPKCMPQRQDGRGDWYDGLEGAPYEGLYRLPELVAADLWEPVFIVGGEKCADAVAELGGVATCNAGGEGIGKWRDWYSEYFRGRPVVILADDDATGQQHAQAVAEALGNLAATVRLVTLEGAHDVADWIAAGHTFAELRTITAHAPIIAAHKLSSLNGSFTSQDGLSKTNPQNCPNCQRLEERARIAETSLVNLRQERAAENRYLALPNETLSAPAKLAAIALRREMNDKPHRERDADGRPRIYRAAIAARMGVGESAVGASLQKLATVGLFERRERRSRDDTATFYAPGPHFDQPEAAPAPERANSWGGKRARVCPSCGSEDLETRIVCRDCGAVVERHDTNKPLETPEDDADEAQSLNGSFTSQDATSNDELAQRQGEGQEYFPPLSILVSDLAPQVASPLESRTPLGDPQGDLRAAVLASAEARDWPRLALSRAESVPSGAPRWHNFTRSASAAQLRAALAALSAQPEARTPKE